MITPRLNATRLAAGLTSLALVAAACGGGDDAAEETTTVVTEEATTTTEPSETTTTSTTEPAEPSEPPSTQAAVGEPLRQPLTGEIAESAEDLVTRPALAVKIDNHPKARANHSGLAVADLVFEEIVEGTLTRFAAVFHTQDADPVGPIRSGRSQDIDILSSLNSPLFAWSGGNPGVTRLVRDSFLTDLNWQRNAGSYQRGPGEAPHNLYSSTETLFGLTPDDQPGPPTIQWTYVPENAAFSGVDVSGLDVTMDGVDVTWDWDTELERFVRSQEGAPHVDKTYGPITATNVVVMAVEYQPSAVDRNSPEAQTIGEGLVYVFSNGSMIEGKWSRGLAVGALKFNDLDGNPIPLTPGNTWIELAELIDGAGPDESPIEMVIRER